MQSETTGNLAFIKGGFVTMPSEFEPREALEQNKIDNVSYFAVSPFFSNAVLFFCLRLVY